MASIFGKQSTFTSFDKSEKPALVSKQSSSTALGPLPESVFHPPEVRIVHVSNTYNFLHKRSSIAFLPKGDILVHSGDFTNNGTDEEYAQFDGWLRAVKHIYHYRLVVLGMRDVRRYGSDWDVMRSLLPHATHVLCHEEVCIMGIRFYGCPWNWGHDYDYSIRPVAPASTCGRFDDIPSACHVLVTHGAAYGTLDCSGFDKNSKHLGSRELADAVQRTRPGLHLHGHVDMGRGVSPAFKSHPLTLNSCVCDEDHNVMYATAQVVKGSKLLSEGGESQWVFSMASLEE